VHLATALPGWTLVVIAAAILALAVFAYRRARGLSSARRSLLVTLRAAALGLVVLCLLRPMVPITPTQRDAGVIGVLVDQSRSMGLRDAGGLSRLERAAVVIQQSLLPSLGKRWRVETWLFGDGLRDARDVALAPTADRSDLAGAVTSAVERLRGRSLAGLVVLTDGARTDRANLADIGSQAGVPIVTVGIGRTDGRDIAVRSVTASESRLDASLVDLTVAAESRQLDGPVEMRLLQDGRIVARRSVDPGPGGAIRALFTVAPGRQAPTVYTVDLSPKDGELTEANNHVSVLVPPPGRRRRVLVLQGAPGFEHTFLTRAWGEDPSLDVDSVVRKGRDERGADTFFVQAAGSRSETLAGGFPATKEALYSYDVVALANMDARALRREQLEWLRDFVAERGGGLLTLGARSLDAQAIADSPIEEVLPLRPGDGGSVVRAAATRGGNGERVRLTADGRRHPLMRIAANDDDSGKRWAALPTLAAHVRLGAARPGASILATAEGQGGALDPVVAVQRFGAGRAMIFAGEASWRWKMLMPATDGSYDRFWRQAARWLSAEAPDAVAVDASGITPDDDDVTLAVDARDAAFVPAADASVTVRVEPPDGTSATQTATLIDPARGRFEARVSARAAGIYRAHIEAVRKGTRLGAADVPWLVGGIDEELADPRLDAIGLRRLAEASGGAYLTPERAVEAGKFLLARHAGRGPTEWRDAWHRGWMFMLIVALVSVEWTLRRQWGLK
jgi:uncharacterized membrane protein